MLEAWSFSRVMHKYNCTLVDVPICRGLVVGYLLAVKCGKGVVKGLTCFQLLSFELLGLCLPYGPKVFFPFMYKSLSMYFFTVSENK